jgi:carbon monoxide dehydrogenase subunit G
MRGDDMKEQSVTGTDAPSPSEFTSSPLRNRLRLELDAPVSGVWELLGDLSRFPEYSVGLDRVEAETDQAGRCVEYTCYFKPVDGGSLSAVSRDVMKWYEPERGYLSVEVEGDAGTDGAVALTTLEPTPTGTRVGYEMYFDSQDLEVMKAQLDEVFADMADRLITRFGGKVLDRYVEK